MFFTFAAPAAAMAAATSNERSIVPKSLSNDLNDIERDAKKRKLSDRRLRELIADAKTKPHHINPKKDTKAFALSEWGKEEHKGLYFVTMSANCIPRTANFGETLPRYASF